MSYFYYNNIYKENHSNLAYPPLELDSHSFLFTKLFEVLCA